MCAVGSDTPNLYEWATVMDEIFRPLQERFPLLTRLLSQDLEGALPPQALPAYLGIFLAVLDQAPASPVCFILPRRGDVARMSAVLYVMHRLVLKQATIAQSYAGRNFNTGDHVCVHPYRYVYRYGGYDLKDSAYIWLESLHKSGGKWRVPATDVISRLERTTRTRPLGRLNSPIRSLKANPLDMLLGTSFSGNLSLLENELIMLDSVSGFEGFAEMCGFHIKQLQDPVSVKDILPFGRIVQPDTTHPGWLRNRNDNGGTGEPVIAITHSAELLANYCIDASPRSKLIVANGLDLLRNLQAYDDISQSQRLVLFSDRDEAEQIEILGDRGCRFWTLGGRELAAHVNMTTTAGILGPVTRWAKNYDLLSIDSEPCEDSQLDTIWQILDKFRGAAGRGDDAPLAKIISRAWRLFQNVRSAWASPTEDERKLALSEIEALRQEIRQNQAWISSEDAQAISRLVGDFDNCYASGSMLGVVKGEALARVVERAVIAKRKVAVLVRNEAKIPELRQFLASRNLLADAEVFSPRTYPGDGNFDLTIFVSWLWGDAMAQVVSKLAAPRVAVIAYPCERLWLRRLQSQLKRKLRAPTLSGDEMTSLVYGKNHTGTKWPEGTQEEPVPGPAIESDILDFERQMRLGRIGLAVRPTDATDTLPARYVRFSGNCYAFLTETHKLPVATDFVSGRVRTGQKLPERTLPEIKPGDYVVFPESGDRELIQELADRLIGPSAGELRKTAHLWKDVLHSSGLTPDAFFKQAHALDRPLHRATIRYWFADTSQIGPHEKEDLHLIAIITGNERFVGQIETVRAAIERLWSAHLSAGMRLRDVLLQRLPRVIDQVEENGTRVDLDDLGAAWIVRVEAIELAAEPRGRNEINRLLFEESGPDLSDLLGEVI